jgi:hypothetical protein
MDKDRAVETSKEAGISVTQTNETQAKPTIIYGSSEASTIRNANPCNTCSREKLPCPVLLPCTEKQ